jgi:hypothetical protein
MIANDKLWMPGEDPIGEQLAQSRLWPTVHDEPGDDVQVGAWIDVVRDTAGDDGQDRSRPLATDVEPGEEPIFAIMERSS